MPSEAQTVPRQDRCGRMLQMASESKPERHGANHKEIQMAQYMCGPCGWIYDEEFGDPEHGLAPGTKFEDIPDDWKCPECGVGKEDFYLLDFVI